VAFRQGVFEEASQPGGNELMLWTRRRHHQDGASDELVAPAVVGHGLEVGESE
jgi:hypothetical protein